MSGITKTIPQKAGIDAVEALYDGRVGEFEFHMAGKPCAQTSAITSTPSGRKCW